MTIRRYVILLSNMIPNVADVLDAIKRFHKDLEAKPTRPGLILL